MPYIDQSRRDSPSLNTDNIYIDSVGELNFVLTKICLNFLGSDPCYADFNDIVGVLESCKLEFYRRAASRYEDAKIISNGDVY